MQRDAVEPTWRSSSYSSGNGQCVEVGDNGSGSVPVRDSKTPSGPRLFFAADAWGSFIGAVRGEEL
ncbi:DUF397 domain-containing protein [Streptomyces sp. MSC1_001]|uniref:DUF397 domain-containing protein n=1 Tax=Streptomyces sp. MSC1_001 TaxID=2909263 RepID=UPI00203074AA|nr:DUF397 domain-containing protein [Streptomyces sp. MSC1_001]